MEVTANKYGISFGDDKNVLELVVIVCTTLSILTPELYTLWGTFYGV